jgi:hypothetical protein
MFSALFGWLGGLLSALGAFFKEAYEWLRKHILRHIVAVLTAAYEIAAQIATQIKKILQTIRGWYFKHVYPIQKKILEVISVTRVFLSLLRLLGVKWAAKLDADLQKIAGYVTLSILYVLNALNTLSSYMDLIVDPGMILARPFLAASVLSNLDLVKRAGAYGSNNPLNASDAQREQDSNTLIYQRDPLAVRDAQGNLTVAPAYQNVLGEIDAGTAAEIAGQK